MNIYTKKGDRGETFLSNQKKIAKSHPLINAIGSLDELQAFIGLVKTKTKNNETKKLLLKIEYDLYLIMGYLSKADINLSSFKEKTLLFETIIKKKGQKISLKGFVLPGKNEISSWFHILRTITRRCERKVVSLIKKNKEDKNFLLITAYLNRLSDLFFVLSL